MIKDISLADVYVAACAGDEVKVVCKSKFFSKILNEMGFKFEPLESSYLRYFDNIEGMYFVLKAKNDGEKAEILSKLRDLGVPFAGGKEWNPQEVFELFRDRGLLHGKYIAIGWNGPNVVETVEK